MIPKGLHFNRTTDYTNSKLNSLAIKNPKTKQLRLFMQLDEDCSGLNLHQKIRPNHALQHLTLDCDANMYANHSFMRQLLQPFYKQAPWLHSLQITVTSFHSLSLKDIHLLTKFLSHCAHLKHLIIEMPELALIRQNDIPSLIACLKFIPQLQSLHLTINEPKNFTNSVFKFLIATINKHCNLSELSLELYANEMLDDNGITALRELDQPQLQSFKLNLESNQKISTYSVQQIYCALINHPKLEHIHLNFAEIRGLKDAPEQYLFNLMSQLPNLRSYSLNLGRSPWLSELSSCANNLANASQLTHLDLNFSKCPQITNRNIAQLSHSLTHLAKLKQLNLNLGKCKRLSHQSLKSVRQALLSLLKCSNYTLKFNIEMINDKIILKQNQQRLTDQLYKKQDKQIRRIMHKATTNSSFS